MAGNTETLVRHWGAHAAGCAQAEPQTATDEKMDGGSAQHQKFLGREN